MGSNESEEFIGFVKLTEKIYNLCFKCSIELERVFENYKHSDNIKLDDIKDRVDPSMVNKRVGKYFTFDNHRSCWFLGMTFRDSKVSFSIAYNGKDESPSGGEKEGDWTYYDFGQSFLDEQSIENQQKKFNEIIETFFCDNQIGKRKSN